MDAPTALSPKMSHDVAPAVMRCRMYSRRIVSKHPRGQDSSYVQAGDDISGTFTNPVSWHNGQLIQVIVR
jgi:hypothetical protein